MEDSTWRKMFLFLILQFTGALSQHRLLSSTVRAGDDVTLSCENVIKAHSNCNTTTWNYNKRGQSAEELVGHGKVMNTRSDRLSVSANCSLVVKNVTDEDVGLYGCRQYVSGRQSGPDASVRLSLVRLTEQENQDRVTLFCSVETDEQCKHSVKWLFKSNDVDKNNNAFTESSSSCSAAVAFQTSHYIYTSRFNAFKCEVKIEDKVQLFTFSSRPSEEDKTAITSAVTTKPDETSANRNTPTHSPDGEQSFLWLYITLPLLLLALIITLFILLKRTRGRKAKQTSNDGVTLRAAETQSASENQQHEVDQENGVSYASISYTKKSSGSRDKNDEGEAVTYSTMKAPDMDPSSLYASIKKPNKQSEVP